MGSILLLNLGTTSFKCGLYDFSDGENCLAVGEYDRIGGEGTYKVQAAGHTLSGSLACSHHMAAFTHCISLMVSPHVLDDMDGLAAVAFKAVHGGKISGTVEVTDEVLLEMEKMISYAPAHNPIYIALMRALKEKHPGLIQIARFETSFHSTIPDYRRIYGIPYAWTAQYGIKRYGFHGSSHQYIAGLHKGKRVISMHLGGSSSLCAILDGQSIATTMGMTPQSGLFHNNRVGDFDPFCIPDIMEKTGMDFKSVLKCLSTGGGFMGISGVSNDLRDVAAAAENGDARCKLAIDSFVDNIVGYTGMFIAYLGGLDTLVFTGGIGVNNASIRIKVCQKLAYLGVRLSKSPATELISAPESSVDVYAIKTNEELIVARSALALLRDRA